MSIFFMQCMDGFLEHRGTDTVTLPAPAIVGFSIRHGP